MMRPNWADGWISILVIACLLLLATSAAVAESSLEVGWSDLIGQVEPYDDPFLSLSDDQILALSVIAKIRERRDRGDELSGVEVAELQEKEKVLKAQGIDADYLLGQREIIIAKRTAAANAFNDSLDRQRIRMPGFILPLEFDGNRVKEFLLVPVVGACIHVPPPPPNQIVYVKVEESIEFGGFYAPIWVTGEMMVKQATKNLFMVDGSSDVDVGYTMQASQVEPYSE